MLQPSLFPDIVPDAAVDLADRRIGHRVNGRGGFRSLPRFIDVMACATKVGEAFSVDAIDGALVKNYTAARIDYAASVGEVVTALWGDRDVAALGEGCATDATGAIRVAVKRSRQAVNAAQDAGDLLPAPIKVMESSKDGRAVVLIQSVLVRIPDQKTKLVSVVESAIGQACDPDAIRYVLPALIKPEEWEAAIGIMDEVEALRWAMVETDKRLTAAIRRATRPGEGSASESIEDDQKPTGHDGKLGRKARIKARKKRRKG
jgi:hypothetical protein